MNNRPTIAAHSSLVIELEKYKPSGDVQVVISIPGRMGTSRFLYRGGPGSRLDVPTADDLKALVSQLLQDWLVTTDGLQEVLPLP